MLCSIGIGICRYEFGYEETNPKDNFLFIDSLPIYKTNQQYWCNSNKVNKINYNNCNGNQSRAYSERGKYSTLIVNIKLDNLTIKHLKDKSKKGD